MVDLCYKNAGTQTGTLGLSIAHKLKYEHTYLMSFSKMRVDLAWVLQQICVNFILKVLSSSAATVLMVTSGPEDEETWKFIENMDKFFDCYNVSSYSAGKKALKEFQKLYSKPTDCRLNVS